MKVQVQSVIADSQRRSYSVAALSMSESGLKVSNLPRGRASTTILSATSSSSSRAEETSKEETLFHGLLCPDGFHFILPGSEIGTHLALDQVSFLISQTLLVPCCRAWDTNIERERLNKQSASLIKYQDAGCFLKLRLQAQIFD